MSVQARIQGKSGRKNMNASIPCNQRLPGVLVRAMIQAKITPSVSPRMERGTATNMVLKKTGTVVGSANAVRQLSNVKGVAAPGTPPRKLLSAIIASGYAA